jgi:hypothetical protein
MCRAIKRGVRRGRERRACPRDVNGQFTGLTTAAERDRATGTPRPTHQRVQPRSMAMDLRTAGLWFKRFNQAAWLSPSSTSQLITAVKCGATHPKVRAEATSAVSALARAGRDVRRVGVTNALRDDQVATQLRQARSHAWNAAATARRPPPRRRLVVRTRRGRGRSGCSRWRSLCRMEGVLATHDTLSTSVSSLKCTASGALDRVTLPEPFDATLGTVRSPS